MHVTYQVVPHVEAGWVGRIDTDRLDFLSVCRTADRRGLVAWGATNGYEATALWTLAPGAHSEEVLQAMGAAIARDAEALIAELSYARMLAVWWRLSRRDAPDLWQGWPLLAAAERGENIEGQGDPCRAARRGTPEAW